MNRFWLLLTLLLCGALSIDAQEFVNLTASEVKIGEALPVCYHEFPLGKDYADTVYSVSIDYPEFVEMSDADIRRYQQITDEPLSELPAIQQYVGISRRQATLYVSFVPLVFREGKYQKLVSFQLNLTATALAHGDRAVAPGLGLGTAAATPTRASSDAADRYAAHSVLATGQWAKISIPQTGVYQLTEALVRQAGFSNINKVKIYGYGGALQPEVLTGDYLTANDDLHEVPVCIVGGRRLFHATGPVSWGSNTSSVRTRNPYATEGCYFLTESDDEPLTVDSAAFVSSFYPAADDYHSLYESDEFAWYHSGRNLFEKSPIPTDGYKTCELPAHDTSGTLTMPMPS